VKRWIWILIVIVAIGVFITWRAFSLSVPHRPDVAATPEMVKRGEYLAQAGDCISCHTAPGHEAFAGGREFDLGNMGKLYSPNITPDRETGIGDWSDDDFRSAMQIGVGKGGEHLYPAFPYASFTLVSDDDVLAIKAYLLSLKPVHSVPPPDAMPFPYNQRWLMAFWSWMFDSNERFVADGGQSPQWNRGKYLVEGLGHCGECHTPRNILQARKSSEAYAGAVTQGWKAYDISPDQQTGIGAWTEAAMEAYLSNGFAEAHGPASGPMAEAISNSLRHLTTDDIHSMVVYLRTVKAVPATTETAASGGGQTGVASAGQSDPYLAYGRQVFAGNCANCHKPDGTASQSAYEALLGSHTVSDPQAINLTQVVLYGSTLETPNGRVNMPAFGKSHSDTEIAALVDYVSAQLGGHSAGLTPEDIAKRR
jgi:mono/diheme cytochrome c family protein